MGGKEGGREGSIERGWEGKREGGKDGRERGREGVILGEKHDVSIFLGTRTKKIIR